MSVFLEAKACKMFLYCSIIFYFESVRSIVNQKHHNSIFTVYFCNVKAFITKPTVYTHTTNGTIFSAAVWRSGGHMIYQYNPGAYLKKLSLLNTDVLSKQFFGYNVFKLFKHVKKAKVFALFFYK